MELGELTISELRNIWKYLWNREPPCYLRRSVLEKSINYKKAELAGELFSERQKKCLDEFVIQYRKNKNSFRLKLKGLNVGSRLIRKFHKRLHIVEVANNSFYYNGKAYSTLSHIVFEITGRNQNASKFFNLNRKAP